MTNPRLFAAVVAVALMTAGAAVWFAQRGGAPQPRPEYTVRTREEQARDFLFAELQPVKLANCQLARFGESNDGGYLLCANLLTAVKSAYSYGISGYDGWGCDVSKRLHVAVHQYDCFDPKRPVCAGGDTRFHSECIGPQTSTDEDGRPFDTLERQLAKNGDAGKHVVIKMDVEGAEWPSLAQASDDVIDRIDQLAIELHDFDRDVGKFLSVVLRLKRFFHVAHLHFNNYSCMTGLEPFPAQAYEVLFVNKRLATGDATGAVTRPTMLDAPNDPSRPDCQFAGK
jgi:hypothetical protein